LIFAFDQMVVFRASNMISLNFVFSIVDFNTSYSKL